ncbi:hypothetical protein FRX31_035481 [Thalictrum thalictroides]|uniref:Fibronectin type III-like domain-containing protein n=1 Tax=Thalictrum thalictroides TaxID=46969 RepID=A0A7J6UQT3_THATH|nr:hypothetical protein FRX31_035481 [Thalictrum thalictroides]
MDGSHVVLLYSVAPTDIIGAPIKRLIGFQRVFIKSRKTVQVRFDLNGCKSFSIIDKDANELLPAGEHLVVVGDGYEKISTKISFQFTNIN